MKQRVITGFLAGLFFITVVIAGGWLFVLLAGALAVIGFFELLYMRKLGPLSFPGIAGATAVVALVLFGQLSLTHAIFYSFSDVIFLTFFLLLAYTVLSENTFHFEEAAFVFAAVLYVGSGFYFFVATRLAADGLNYIVYLLFIVWASDSGAYFFGKSLGKKKLWPAISPNKTVEGFFGALLCAAVVGGVYHIFSPVYSHFATTTFVAILISVVGQFGDLIESALKRHFCVKDSGNLLPGHGGILDRFDSLLLILPVLHLLALI